MGLKKAYIIPNHIHGFYGHDQFFIGYCGPPEIRTPSVSVTVQRIRWEQKMPELIISVPANAILEQDGSPILEQDGSVLIEE